MNGKSMVEGTPWKHILRFAPPVLAGSLLQQLYNTVDTIIVVNVNGEDALSAVGTTTSFTFMFLALAMGFSAGNGVIVSQHYSDENEKQVKRRAFTGILLLLGMGVISTVLVFVLSGSAYISDRCSKGNTGSNPCLFPCICDRSGVSVWIQ